MSPPLRPRTRQEVHTDALQVTRLLLPPQPSFRRGTGSIHCPVAFFARAHLHLALQQATSLYHDGSDGRDDPAVEERIAYVHSVIDEVVDLLVAVGGRRFEELFDRAISQLEAYWNLTRCSSESVSLR